MTSPHDYRIDVLGVPAYEDDPPPYRPLVGPGAGVAGERCALCGETIGEYDEPGEMHDPAMYDESLTQEERDVAAERVPCEGLVHAQCGFDRGWVVS